MGITSFGPAECGDASSDVTAAYTEIADYASWIDSVLDGQRIPTVTVTEQDRLDYLAANGRVIYQGGTISSDEGGGGGGSVSLLITLKLTLIALLRRRVDRVIATQSS
ncbi:secreted trypsin-like serine protease [Vibrio maritimus]|uniref:Secreted trypsin-like serine protease n=1 Tax=Vibrio maritimus TaxID=990268 RepID=A0A090RSD5_9VIBR|nr:secreted trypsin-like serine protease [Vibrio maritimus]